MTLKRQIRRWNYLMIGFPLLIAVITILVGMFYYKESLQKIEIEDNTVYQVQEKIVTIDYQRMINDKEYQQETMDALDKQEYHLQIEGLDTVLVSNFTNTEQKEIGELTQNIKYPGIYKMSDSTVVYHIDTNTTYEITVINLSKSRNQLSLESIFLYLLLLFLIPVASIVLVNYLLTRTMMRGLLKPIDLLCVAANRIEQGDVDYQIQYQGYQEFMNVCNSFNEMTNRLKMNIEKNSYYENNRKEMIAGISHDLKTPLTSIKGYIIGLKDGIVNTVPKQKEYIEVIYRKTLDMEKLLTQLQSFSLLETNNTTFSFTLENITMYLQEFVHSRKMEFEEKGCIVTLVDSLQEVKIKMDTNQMDRVLLNIIENSIKYKVKQIVEVTISTYIKDAMVCIEIKDNGAGVLDEQLPYLFERFYRADESRNGKIEGHGLGLSIAKYIIKEHGGTIKAMNTNGLSIVIMLPLLEE